MAGAIMLGITIHFFIVSRRTLNASSPQTQIKINKELEQRKLRYLNDIEWRDKEMVSLNQKIAELEENNEILSIEAEELREKNKKLSSAPAPAPVVTVAEKQTVQERTQYGEMLQAAQAELIAYSKKISQMLSKVNVIEDMEERHEELKMENESLQLQVEELTLQLHKAEQKLTSQQHKSELTTEMSSMLDNAFSEFSVLQEKLSKLEGQVAGSQKVNLDYIDAQEELMKLTRQLEEDRSRYGALLKEKNQLEAETKETGEKLKEANFQRQQMQKQIAYLEELNMDLQSVAEVNTKLQIQIKRIGELESMLQMLSEEKQELLRRKS